MVSPLRPSLVQHHHFRDLLMKEELVEGMSEDKQAQEKGEGSPAPRPSGK